MKTLLLPLLLGASGLGGGLAAGHFLKPAASLPAAEGEVAAAAELAPAPEPDGSTEFVKLDRQFVVPVIAGEKVEALMVISMAIEVEPGGSDRVFAREPKLRDEFLRVLFVHAQSGGFSGVFTEPRAMEDLRASLAASARSVLGPGARSVLLTNLVRQDLG